MIRTDVAPAACVIAKAVAESEPTNVNGSNTAVRRGIVPRVAYVCTRCAFRCVARVVPAQAVAVSTTPQRIAPANDTYRKGARGRCTGPHHSQGSSRGSHSLQNPNESPGCEPHPATMHAA